MGKHRMYLVQAEFYFVAGKVNEVDIHKLLASAIERSIEGSRTKLAVRFFDESGKASRLLFKLELARAKEELLFKKWINSKASLHKSWLLRSLNKIRHTIESDKLKAKSEVMFGFKNSISRAIELQDRSFRLVENNEVHECIEAMRTTDMFRIIVFAPNALLSDTNTVLAHC